jgi:Ca2+-binding EF-hand superfamily protein
MKKLIELFKYFDDDNDGLIDSQSMKQILNIIGYPFENIDTGKYNYINLCDYIIKHANYNNLIKKNTFRDLLSKKISIVDANYITEEIFHNQESQSYKSINDFSNTILDQ